MSMFQDLNVIPSENIYDTIKHIAVMKGGELSIYERNGLSAMQPMPMTGQSGGALHQPIQYVGGPTPGPYVSDGFGTDMSQVTDSVARPGLDAYSPYVGGAKLKKWISQAELERCIDMKGLRTESKRRVAKKVNEYVNEIVQRAATLVKNKKRIMSKGHLQKALRK